MKECEGEYTLQFPGSEEDVVFWQAIVVHLMARLGKQIVAIPLSELRGRFDLQLAVAAEFGAVVLDRNRQVQSKCQLEHLPVQGTRPS